MPPPYRVVAAHNEPGHDHETPFQVGGTQDTLELAENARDLAAKNDFPRREYDLVIEELVEVKGPGKDGLQGSHRWERVKPE